MSDFSYSVISVNQQITKKMWFFIRDVDIFIRPVYSFDFYILKSCSYVPYLSFSIANINYFSKIVMNNTVMMHTIFNERNSWPAAKTYIDVYLPSFKESVKRSMLGYLKYRKLRKGTKLIKGYLA